VLMTEISCMSSGEKWPRRTSTAGHQGE